MSTHKRRFPSSYSSPLESQDSCLQMTDLRSDLEEPFSETVVGETPPSEMVVGETVLEDSFSETFVAETPPFDSEMEPWLEIFAIYYPSVKSVISELEGRSNSMKVLRSGLEELFLETVVGETPPWETVAGETVSQDFFSETFVAETPPLISDMEPWLQILAVYCPSVKSVLSELKVGSNSMKI